MTFVITSFSTNQSNYSILMCENDRIKISDFGVSRFMGDKSTKMTFVGTVAWMAPEVIRHEPYSEKVDVWSYGVVIWELLTQQRPYSVRGWLSKAVKLVGLVVIRGFGRDSDYTRLCFGSRGF